MSKWTIRSTERTALRLPRRELLDAADREGAVSISGARLAQLAGVSRKTAWAWLRGYPVSPEVDAAFLAALKISDTAG